MKRQQRRLKTGRFFLQVLAVTILMAVSSFFLLTRTDTGRTLLINFIERAASDPDISLSIGKLEGNVPFDMVVRDLKLADKSGSWLEIDHTHIIWKPLSLFSGVLDMSLIEANALKIIRLPEEEEGQAQRSDQQATLFHLPFGIKLNKLQVNEIALDSALFGQPARLKMQGSAELIDFKKGLRIELVADRIDKQGGHISGQFAYVPEGEILTIDMLAQEPAGGMVSRAAGIAEMPPLSFIAKGTGPLDNWKGELSLDLAEKASADGHLTVKRQGTARILTSTIFADIASLLPENIAPLAEGKSELEISAHFSDNGDIELKQATLVSAAASLSTQGHFEKTSESISGKIHLAVGEPSIFERLIPLPMSWSQATLDVDVGGTWSNLKATALLSTKDIAAEQYQAHAGILKAILAGRGSPLDEKSLFDFTIDGKISGISSSRPALSRQFGETIELSAKGSINTSLVAKIEQAHLALQPSSLRFSGMVNPDEVIGKLDVERADLEAVQAFIGPDLRGQIKLNADIDIAFDLSRLSVMLEGDADQLRTGIAQADGLMGDHLNLSGGVERREDGSFKFQNLTIKGDNVTFVADGAATQTHADIIAKLTLPDLSRLDQQLTGSMKADGRLTGNLDHLDGKATLLIPNGSARGRPIKDLKFDIESKDLLGFVSGEIKLTGSVDGKPARGEGRFTRVSDKVMRLEKLDASLGSFSLKGVLSLNENQLATGQISLIAGNLNDISPLLLSDLEGKVKMQADLSIVDGGQQVHLTGFAEHFSGFGTSVRVANVNVLGHDLQRNAILNAQFKAADIVSGDVSIPHILVTAKGSGQANDVRIEGTVQGSSVLALARVKLGQTTNITFNQARISKGAQHLEMLPNARIDITKDIVRISDLELRSGNGRLSISGDVGENLNIRTSLQGFPLTIARLFASDLEVTGTLSGETKLSGPLMRLEGNYHLNVANLTLPEMRTSGIKPITLNAKGVLANGRMTTDTSIRGQNNMSLHVHGSIPLGNGTWDLAIAGPIDLGMANVALSASGQTLNGTANIDARLRGTSTLPIVAGTVRVANARFSDPSEGIYLDNIQAFITGNEREIVINNLKARTRNGGNIHGAGHIVVDATAGFPGSITIQAKKAQLIASEIVNLVADLNLRITGPLAKMPVFSGNVEVDNLQIRVPDRFPPSLTPIEVQHIHPPPRLRARIEREQAESSQATAAKAFNVGFDVTVNAPARVFVRGQGINAELEGKLRVRGSNITPIVDGGFQMRRGTLSMVGRRLTFSRGEVSFAGDSLDPTLDFLAEAPASDVTAQINVTGYASEPKISVSSRPQLPRDEVFARLIFGKPAGSLSASQTIQLAQAIAQLTGLGGDGAMGSLARSLGLDAVTISPDDAGNFGVGINKRINDNIYLGVKQGASSSSSRITVDIGVTDHIKLQGEAGADGSGAAGIGMEWDY